ncbi:response regulator transcription factor [Desulfosporosinus sp. BICA1-9]|uniref:response regulator n=1 Tax=Desulfosporosinus sp. BICA1-9 TaxID=1531958 RepID=UPI000AF2BC96|nr:response regulator transcription factor [Desulfosporosinus sp. BICA1-9]HBW34418.1 DNA-binding response regulator [Desulfosporosinus sp.]
MQKISVLLVDDHQVIRKGLRLVLEDSGEIEVVGEASNGEEAIELTFQYAPDLVIMDLNLPGIDGIQAMKMIKDIKPDQRVLVLTMHEDSIYLDKVLAAGGNGFVLKRVADVELLSAIRAVHRGEFYVDTSFQKYLVTRALKPERYAEMKKFELTTRETELLQLIALGYSNMEIAKKLNISIKTVENHKTRIHDKLGINSRSKLVRYAKDNGLV